MNRTCRVCALVLGALQSAAAVAENKEDNWPQFRGPGAAGVARGEAATTWDVPGGRNVLWKTAIPGLAHSSPIVWGDRIYVTTAVADSPDAPLKIGLYGDIESVHSDEPHSFRVLAIDKLSGNILWDKELYKGVPKVKRHPKSTHANSTPVTDGERIVAFFGSEGLYCLDRDGNVKWKKDFGLLDSGYFAVKSAQWGFGNSPVIHDGKLIIQCDVQENSFIALYDLADGREIWMTPRAEVPTWGSPTVYDGPGGRCIAVNGWKHIGGYEFETGKEVWKLVGGGDIPVPTPVVAHGLIFITNAHGGMAPIYAIRTSARGEFKPPKDGETSEQVAWWANRKGNYMQTPIVVGERLYMCMDNGVMACYDAKTGEQKYRKRLGSGSTGFTASPVSAGGKLYYTSEEGDVYVLKAGDAYEELAKNSLGEPCMATPAVSEGILFFRGEKHLIAVK